MYTLNIWLRDVFKSVIPPNNYNAVMQHLRPNNRSITYTNMDSSSYFFSEFEANEIGDHHISVVVTDQKSRHYWVYDQILTITEDNSATLHVFGSGSVMANWIASSSNQYEGVL